MEMSAQVIPGPYELLDPKRVADLLKVDVATASHWMSTQEIASIDLTKGRGSRRKWRTTIQHVQRFIDSFAPAPIEESKDDKDTGLQLIPGSYKEHARRKKKVA